MKSTQVRPQRVRAHSENPRSARHRELRPEETIMTTCSKSVLLAVCVLIAACGGEPQEEAAAGAGADSTEAPAMPMPGMQGMSGMQRMDSMMARMQQMQGVSADSMRAMMPMHRQMADSALAAMEGDMRAMNVTPDAGWSALADSLRQDMTRMSAMSGSEMMAAMPEHHARMQRLMERHRAMMPATPR
jgi:hypothetical protein